ncbi:MAG: VanZ family protein [Desulfuromonadaceae bacterium]|nr:VanZ family protein [Desulfuromonadaceae bacterium]
MTMSTIRTSYSFLIISLLFIVYGSLFPLSDWRMPDQRFLGIWQQALHSHISRSDLLTNLLAYIPVGYFLSSVFSRRIGSIKRIALACCVGLLLSCSLELVQLFLPARTSSPMDVAFNTFSSVLGALAFNWFGSESVFGVLFGKWRQNHIYSGAAADTGLLVFFLWGAAQLAPFVPSLDFGTVKNGIKPLWQSLHDPSRFNWYRAITYGLNISCLGAVQQLIGTYRGRALPWLGLYCGSIFLIKPLIAGRQISLEALVGLAFGVCVSALLRTFPKKNIIAVGWLSVACAFIIEELRPDSLTLELHSFNWIPFTSQVAENMSGISAILEGIWPFATVGFYAVIHASSGKKIPAFFYGSLLAGCVFALEYAQTGITGRYPDITPVVLAGFGWSIPMLVVHKHGNTNMEHN